jgi:hypothetical protein
VDSRHLSQQCNPLIQHHNQLVYQLVNQLLNQLDNQLQILQ